MESFDGLDHGASYFFHHLAMETPALEGFMRAGALWLACPWTMTALAAAVLGLFTVQQRWRALASAALTMLMAVVFVEVAPLLIWRPRPQGASKYLGSGEFASYPSRGVLYMTLLALLFGLALQFWLRLRWQVLLVHVLLACFVIWVCVAELWLELSFVTDVIGGLAGGTGLGLLARYLGGRAVGGAPA